MNKHKTAPKSGSSINGCAMGLRGSSSGLESGSFLYGWVTEKDDKETEFSRVQWHRGQEVRPRKQAEHKSVCLSACASRREEAPGVLEQQPGSPAPRPTGTLALGLLATALLRGPCWQVLAQGGGRGPGSAKCQSCAF